MVTPAGQAQLPDERIWLPATATRHFAQDDPLLDWLDAHGAAAGFVPDDARNGYRGVLDFNRFVVDQGRHFEAGVLRLLGERHPVAVVTGGGGHFINAQADEVAPYEETLRLMRAGAPIIAGAVVRSEQHAVYGVADLLVRADVLARLFPASFGPEPAGLAATALGGDWHYRALDIKFTGLELDRTGHAGSKHLAHELQLWLYNEALGEMQGLTPDAAYLLGRSWEQGKERGASCLERLARVDRGHEMAGTWKRPLGAVATEALTWIRRVRTEGGEWRVLPVPSVPELFPNMGSSEDFPWHASKREIADAVGELTLLPGVGPAKRRLALAAGISSWRDERLQPAVLGLGLAFAARTARILEANRRPAGLPPIVLPARFEGGDQSWREIKPVEFFVDFETANSLADDFRSLPRPGGQPLIFQIGCGLRDAEHVWDFHQWTARAMTEREEAHIIAAWIHHMADELYRRGLGWYQTRIFHYSPAETASLETSYVSARVRHPNASWPTDLPWYDLLEQIVRAEPVGITGALGFGLKPVSKAMHAADFIETSWTEGPADGLGAMVGAWRCGDANARTGLAMTSMPLMREIAAYNEVDCRAMAEDLDWFRKNR